MPSIFTTFVWVNRSTPPPHNTPLRLHLLNTNDRPTDSQSVSRSARSSVSQRVTQAGHERCVHRQSGRLIYFSKLCKSFNWIVENTTKIMLTWPGRSLFLFSSVCCCFFFQPFLLWHIGVHVLLLLYFIVHNNGPERTLHFYIFGVWVCVYPVLCTSIWKWPRWQNAKIDQGITLRSPSRDLHLHFDWNVEKIVAN